MSHVIGQAFLQRRRQSLRLVPWAAALLLAGASQVGWLVHEATRQPVVIVAPADGDCTDRELARAPASAEPSLVEAEQPEPEPQWVVNHGAPAAITCASPEHCAVTRAFAAEHASTQAWSNMARFILTPWRGEEGGLKMFGVHAASPLYALGFRNGDLIMAINGDKISSLEDVARIPLSFAEQTELRVSYLRDRVVATKRIEMQ